MARPRVTQEPLLRPSVLVAAAMALRAQEVDTQGLFVGAHSLLLPASIYYSLKQNQLF